MSKVRPYCILTVLILLIYGNTFLNSFHFDDIDLIQKKPWIRGLDKIPSLFSTLGHLTHRPFVNLSFNLNYAISEFQVWSYHFFNILGHIAVTLLVYKLVLLIGETLSRFRGVSINQQIPFLAALVFALHPLNIESVTYISGRSSILVTFFLLAAIILFFKGLLARHLSSNREITTGKLYFAGWLAALFLGVLSKITIITWPVIAFLFHFYFKSKVILHKWLSNNLKWFLITTALLLVVLATLLFAQGKITNTTVDKKNWSVLQSYCKGGKTSLLIFKVLNMNCITGFFRIQTSYKTYSPTTYLLTQSYVIPLEYFWKMFFPFNLSIDIDFPTVSDWTRPTNYLGIAFLLLYVAFFLTCRDYLIGFGMAWTLITLLPTSSFLPLIDLTSEHRTYLPLVGFSIFFATLLCYILDFIRCGLEVNRNFNRRGFKASLVGIILVPIFLSTATVKRNTTWKDELTLWSDAKNKAPRLIRPINNVGQAYKKLHQYDKAISQFEKALHLNPNYYLALNNLGAIHGQLGNNKKAIDYFRSALAVHLDYAPANYNLAKALDVVGEPEKALKYYKKAARLDIYFGEAIFNQAHLESQLGLFQESIKTYLRFIEMNQNHVKAHLGLADTYSKNRQYDKAILAYQQTIQLDPTYLSPQINLARLYLQIGDVDRALTIYEKTLALKTDMAGIHKNLGLIYGRYKNNPEKAIYHFKRSLKLDKKQPQAGIMRNFIESQKNLQK